MIQVLHSLEHAALKRCVAIIELICGNKSNMTLLFRESVYQEILVLLQGAIPLSVDLSTNRFSCGGYEAPG